TFDTSQNEGGVNHFGQLLFANGQFYGLTFPGQNGDDGSIWSVSPDGNGFGTVVDIFGFINVPTGTLVTTNDMIYGETAVGTGGGGSGCAVGSDGTGFFDLHDFTPAEGASPAGVLVLSSNLLFGMTTQNGSNGQGALFSVSIEDGTYTNLFNFAAANS